MSNCIKEILKCLDCWKEIDTSERGKGRKLRCDECISTHRLAYNKRKYREKVMRESLGTFYSRFQSGLRNNIQARGVII
jgi:DNA-directed RNA polymerase subunit RPC12/RpoP